MLFPIGPHRYSLTLIKGFVRLSDGTRALGRTDLDRQIIEISSLPRPSKRLAIAWHEIAHAWKEELDITDQAALDDEAICNMIGLAMVSVGVKVIAKLQVYMTQGIDADDVILIRGLSNPIPVLRMSPN